MRSGLQRLCIITSLQQSLKIIEKGNHHEQRKNHYTDLLPPCFKGFRYRPSLDDLDQVVKQVSTIEHGYRQQIQYAQADRYNRKKSYKGCKSDRGGHTGILRYSDRAGYIVKRGLVT